jgi:hypothetical protein
LLYDPDGRVIADAQGDHVFDAAGERTSVTAGEVGGGDTGHPLMPREAYDVKYDADGNPTKNTSVTRTETLVGDGPQTYITETTEIIYYLRSTALAGYVVGELNDQGQKTKQYVYAGGERLAEQQTSYGYNTINWQHRNPTTDSWVSVDPNGISSFRTEVDAHGRETGLEAPIILANEPPPPPTRSPSYLEMQGAPTIEAELGMQLYEDVYINKIFASGNGPGTGGYDRLRTIREFELQVNGTFLLGLDRMKALTSFGSYEELIDDVKPGWERGEAGIPIRYYRLKPGVRQTKGGTQSTGKPENPTPLTETQVDKLGSNLQKLLDDPECGKFINTMLDSLPNDVWKTSKYGGSLTDGFNRIKNAGGFWSGDTISRKALAITDPNKLKTTFDSQRSTPLIMGQPWEQLGATFVLVHELTHVFTNSPNAGIYGHLQMAQAASAAASSLGLDLKAALNLDFPTTEKYGTGEEYDLALSVYFGRTLSYACRKVKL